MNEMVVEHKKHMYGSSLLLLLLKTHGQQVAVKEDKF
jgi:hypothetical protein